MSREKQIEEQAVEEMARVIETTEQIARDAHCGLPSPRMYAKDLYWHGYRKQSESFSRPHENDGEWKSKHHMSRSPRGRYTSYNTYSCNVCGKANGRRKTPFCPNCGAKMKGGAE